MKCLSGWNTVDSGRIDIDSTPITRISPKKRASVLGFLPQKISVSENIPVIEWLTYSRFRFDEPKSVSVAAVKEGLEASQLAHLSDRTWPQLSGGEAQRLALLGLSLQETKCWLLDEPGNHLDPQVQHILYQQLVRQWQKGTAIVVITHNINLLLQNLPKNLWSIVKILGMKNGTIQWTTSLDDASLSERLGDLYGMTGKAVSVEGTTQIFYMAKSI